MQFKCNICKKFSELVNNEIAIGEYFFDFRLEEILKKYELTEEAKALQKFPLDKNYTEYDIFLSNKISKCFYEAGMLRNIIVHDRGKLSHEYEELLTNTLNVAVVEDGYIRINKKFMASFIEDLRQLFIDCDYKV